MILIINSFQLKRDKVQIFTNLSIFILFLFLFLHIPCNGEGSSSFNSGNSGRSYTIGFGVEGPVSSDPGSTDFSIFHNEWTGILPSSDYRYIYTYAKKGEIINLGTNFTEKSTDITVISPTGETFYYDVTSSSPGFIKNYLQERNGPKTICNTSNCNDFYDSIKITAANTGLYKIAFHSAEYGSMNDITHKLVTEDLISKHGLIAAYDITVTNNGRKIDGRSFTYDISCNTSLGPVTVYSNDFYFYVLSDDGVIYKVTIPRMSGGSFLFIANKRGVVDVVNDTSLHHTMDVFADRNIYRVQNTEKDSFYRIFYNKPDYDLLSFLNLTKIDKPTITDFSFAGNLGDKVTPCNGGIFSFNSDKSIGSFQIVIDFPSGDSVSLSNSIKNGENTIEWNGKTSSGTCFENGGNDTTISATLNLFSGENHILLYDIEGLPNGVIIEAINVNYNDNAYIYYDNEQKTINGTVFAGFLDNKDYSIPGNGIDSKSGTALAYPDPDGNHKLIDVWTYNFQNSYSLHIKHIEKLSNDLRVQKKWHDDNNRDFTRPDNIHFNLFCGSVECGESPYTITEDSDWTITVPDIPIYDDNGQKYRYSVVELGVSNQ